MISDCNRLTVVGALNRRANCAIWGPEGMAESSTQARVKALPKSSQKFFWIVYPDFADSVCYNAERFIRSDLFPSWVHHSSFLGVSLFYLHLSLDYLQRYQSVQVGGCQPFELPLPCLTKVTDRR